MFTGKMVFISDGQCIYALKSKSVWEMHFPVILISIFNDLVNSKKLNLWEKMAVDKSAWIKACTTISPFGTDITVYSGS